MHGIALKMLMTPEIATVSAYLGYKRDIRYTGKDDGLELTQKWNDVDNINHKTI
jgi:hypothetical protein